MLLIITRINIRSAARATAATTKGIPNSRSCLFGEGPFNLPRSCDSIAHGARRSGPENADWLRVSPVIRMMKRIKSFVEIPGINTHAADAAAT